jgi:hypothetical protein
MTPLEAALAEVSSLLDSLQVPYMLIGGLAVAAWGEPRATLDIDVSVWIEQAQLEATLARICERLHPLPADPLAFVRQTRVLPVVTSQQVRADLVFGSLPHERETIERAQARQIAGRTIMTASVEDLVLMKLISEREKDLEDARRLLRRFRHALDRAYLEPRVAELAEALARPEILHVLHGELAS